MAGGLINKDTPRESDYISLENKKNKREELMC